MTDSIMLVKEHVDVVFSCLNTRLSALVESRKKAMAREWQRLLANNEQGGTAGNDNIDEDCGCDECSEDDLKEELEKGLQEGAVRIDYKHSGDQELHFVGKNGAWLNGRYDRFKGKKKNNPHKIGTPEHQKYETGWALQKPINEGVKHTERWTKNTHVDDEQEMTVRHHHDGSMSGENDKHDWTAKNKEEGHAKLKKWGYVKEEIGLNEARRIIIKVNSRGKRRRKILCGKGKKLVGKTCRPIVGKEKQTIRLAQRKRKRTIKRKGAGFRIRANRLRKRALMKRKSMGLSRRKR